MTAGRGQDLLVVGLTVGLTAGLTVGLTAGLTAGLIEDLIEGLIAGLIVGQTAGEGLLTSDESGDLSENLWTDGRFEPQQRTEVPTGEKKVLKFKHALKRRNKIFYNYTK